MDRASASGAENVCSNHTRGIIFVDSLWINIVLKNLTRIIGLNKLKIEGVRDIFPKDTEFIEGGSTQLPEYVRPQRVG